MSFVVAQVQNTVGVSTSQLPTTIGQKTKAASLSVVLASDEDTIGITPTPNPSVGPSLFRLMAAATTNSTLVKGSNANVSAIIIANVRNSNIFVKLYNKATAPTIGTDTPSMTICVPSNQTISIDCGAFGIRFSLGLGIGIVTGMPDNNTAAPTAGDASVTIAYT